MRTVSRREFVKIAAADVAAAAVAASARRAAADAPAGKRPNILFVFADQMRFCAMGCMGNPTVRTPNLDRLASQGVLFTHAFSCTPLCTPYRAQLLTGRYGHATGMTTNDIKLPHEEITLAEALREKGYATGYIGKWHLNAGRRQPAGTAEGQGFIAPGADRAGFDFWAALECSHQYFKTKYYRDKPEPVPVDGYEPDVQTDLAIEFMKQHRAGPFLLMMSWGPPHNPYKPPEKYDLYKPEQVVLRPNVPAELADRARAEIAQYYGLVTSLDACMGRLMKTLDDLGIAGDTLVCFSSDHGDMLRSQGQTLKQRPWEESAHIPFIMRWPAKLPAGQKRDILINSVDVMPTLLGLAGAEVPPAVQGTNLAPALLGQSDREPESCYLALLVGRHGNSPSVGDWRAVRTKDWLYAACSEGDWLLYNVKDDPYELKNLVNDPACRPQKEKLRGMLLDWQKRIGDDKYVLKPFTGGAGAKAKPKAGTRRGA